MALKGALLQELKLLGLYRYSKCIEIWNMLQAKKLNIVTDDHHSDEIKSHYPNLTRILHERQAQAIEREKAARNQLNEQIITSPGDVADESVVDTSAEYFLHLANNQQKEILEIKSALERMQRGVYGICESCEEDVSVERLEKLPYARLCVDCQSLAERKSRASKTSIIPKL